MPRGCRLAYRTECASDGTDSTKRTSVRLPIATVPSRCRVPCDASLAMAECHEFVTRVGFSPHRSLGRQPRNLVDAVAVHVHPVVPEPHQPTPVLLASHSGSHRSAGRRAARLARRRSDDACSLAWRDPWDWGRLRTAAHRATEQLSTISRDQSMSPSRESQFRSAKCIRSQTPSACQSRSRRQHVMPEPQPSSRGNICHGMPLRSTNRMPSGRRDQTHAGVRRSAAMVEPQKWLEKFPQRVGQQRGCHKPTLRRRRGRLTGRFCYALLGSLKENS